MSVLIVIGPVVAKDSVVDGFTAIGRCGGAVTAYVRDAADAPAQAAASDLLAACKFLEAYAEVQVRRHPEATDTPDWRALLAAIARAEGRS